MNKKLLNSPNYKAKNVVMATNKNCTKYNKITT